MATSQIVNTNFRLVYEAGIDDAGDVIFKGKTYSNVKVDSTPDQIYQAAQSLAGLCNLPLYTVERTDKHEIEG